MRKICVLLMAAVMGFGIVGCGEEKKAPPAAPAAPAKTDDKKEEPKKEEPKKDAPAK